MNESTESGEHDRRVATVLPRPSPQAAERCIRAMLPDVDWLLRYLESKGGWFHFPPQLTLLIQNLRIQNYVELYRSEQAIAAAFLNALMDPEEIREFESELATITPEELNNEVSELLVEMVEGDEWELIPKSDAEMAAAREAFERLTESEKARAIRCAQWTYAAFIAMLFNHLSVMIHGVKLTRLVPSALAGDDDAFLKAVQIDRSLLVAHPYFRDRFARAQADGASEFCAELGNVVARPLLRGRLRYRPLWASFAMLDAMNLLDGALTVRQLLDVLDGAGLDRWQNRIEDEGYLAKRLREYRRLRTRFLV